MDSRSYPYFPPPPGQPGVVPRPRFHRAPLARRLAILHRRHHRSRTRHINRLNTFKLLRAPEDLHLRLLRAMGTSSLLTPVQPPRPRQFHKDTIQGSGLNSRNMGRQVRQGSINMRLKDYMLIHLLLSLSHSRLVRRPTYLSPSILG